MGATNRVCQAVVRSHSYDIERTFFFGVMPLATIYSFKEGSVIARILNYVDDNWPELEIRASTVV